ncbi:hypothetical protein [Flavobacterium bizetiae]|uniref:hypothetical protein n=1 Tax=Flavobacterium bizetiae TaxID=2704140 RepID=UPI0037569A42
MIIDDLDIKLQEGKTEFIGDTINLGYYASFSTLDLLDNFNQLKFINCIFNGNLEIEGIKNQSLKLSFKECTFNGDITMSDLDIDYLHFINTKKINSIHIDGSFNRLRFNNKDIPLSGRIGIFATISKELNLDNLFLKTGMLDLSINNFLVTNKKESDYKKFYSTFKNSKIDNWENNNSYFGYVANFKEIEIFNELNFNDCKFNKSYFSLANFGKNTHFNDCKFYSYAGFEECKNIDNTILKISGCLFTSFPHFNNTELKHLYLTHCTFERKTSFDSLKVNSLKINQVTFLQGAYFDDIKIIQIKNCDRKTIRIIKQELQKAENKIDFNKFRNFELEAHYSELSFKENFKDTTILWATKWSSNFGSWTWAFWFTIISGLLWYSILYRIENSGSLNFEKTNDFFVGAFRFFLVTDFYNPLENDRTYLKHGWSWLIFILGKIFIAFGIYEMIQSFRKFKA